MSICSRSQKTGNEKKLAPGVKSLSASGPLAASSAAPHRMGMSHAPKPYRLDPFTQASTLFSPNGESQTPASFRSPQDPAIALASVPGVSTQMDPMLSDVQQSLTAFMGTKGITNNIRSRSSITVRQASANRLKSSLKAVQERKQAVSDRLSSPGQHF